MTRGSDEQVELGRLNGPWGVSGWVKVFSHTDPPEAIFDYQPWRSGPGDQTLEVLEWRKSGPRLVARLSGVDCREDAERVGRLVLSVPRSRLPDPEPGQYYWRDLIGLEVVNTDDHRFGRITGFMDAGAHDVMVIRADRATADILIPFIRKTYVIKVDPAAGRITVDWPAEWAEEGDQGRGQESPGVDDGGVDDRGADYRGKDDGAD